MTGCSVSLSNGKGGKTAPNGDHQTSFQGTSD